LFSNADIHNEAHYVTSNTPIFLFAEFVCSVDKYQLLQWRGDGFWTGKEAKPENIKYKFYFAPKLPNICINQKCSMEIESLHIL